MALSANTLRSYDLGETNEFGVAANAVLYEGAAIGSTGGYARALTAGDTFLGFALEKVTGTAANGGVNVRVRSSGKVQLSISALAITDIQKPVYASDDGTFTLTQSTNSYIGVVHRWVSTGIGIIAFDAAAPAGLTGVTALTDNSGGTANNTIEACAEPVTITDSTGYSGTHDDTLAATAAITTLTDSTGDSGTHDDTLADGLTTTAFVADNGGATADGTVEAMTGLGAALTLTNMEDGSADNTLENIGATNGGDVSGAIERNFDKVGDEVNTLITLTGALANNVQECVDKIQTLTTDVTVQNQNDSDLAQKIIELVTREAIHAQNVSDLGQKVIEIVTVLAAVQNNIADLTAKVNEVIAAQR